MDQKSSFSGGSPIILPVISEAPGCCSAIRPVTNVVPRLNQPFVTGSLPTVVGQIPQLSAQLRRQDNWGTIRARWGVGRMDYMVDPGLYALGNPDPGSPVLVTANYKMSFDRLRSSLPGRNAWILVLDTKGINVWCAAGKGTFGTAELINRIEVIGLKSIVSHRKLILPQLGAPGVASHTVKKMAGFTVYYGPVRAEDLPEYLDSGWQTTPAMRIMTFPFADRAALVPLELVAAAKPFLIIAPLLFVLSGFGGSAGFWTNAVNYGVFAVLAFLSAIISGAVLNPLLLPYLPGRAFSTKGFTLGIIVALFLLYLRDVNLSTWAGRIETLAWLLIIPAVSGYLAMNFTGASTYTSLSGVKKEMRWALPLEIALGGAGLLMWIGAIFIS